MLKSTDPKSVFWNNLFVENCPQYRNTLSHWSGIVLALACFLGITPLAEAKTQYQIQILPVEGQVEHWQAGVHYVDDPKLSSVARVINVQDSLPDKQSTFRVFVLNSSDKPVIFGPENVTIEFSDDKAVQMTTYDELTRRLRRDIKRRQALAVLGNAFSAQGASGYTTGSFDYSGTTANGTHVSGSATYSGHDPALARNQRQAVQEQSSTTDRAIQLRQMSGSQALGSLIRKSTVQPGETFGGIVAFDAPSSFKQLDSSDVIHIVINVGAEKHRIAIKVSRIR